MREPDRAEVYERVNGRLKCITGSAGARGITSPRITLTNVQRGVANYYGACVERREAGPSTGGVLREAVDGGNYVGHAPNISSIEARRCIEVTRRTLAEIEPLAYRPRSTAPMGPHLPIAARALIDAVCVYGTDLQDFAKDAGWWIERTEARKRKDGTEFTHTERIIPKQQSQKIKAALTSALDAVGEAWIAEGVYIPRWLGSIDIR